MSAESPASTASPADRWLCALPFVLAALPGLVYGFWSVFAGTSWADKIIEFNDDAYYYFQVAWHIARGDGSTFDGLSRTNGYHPLWMTLMIGVFEVARTKLQALVIVRAFEGLVFAGSIGLLFLIGRALSTPTLFALGLPLGSFMIGMWLSGLETPATLFLLLLVAFVVVRQARSPREGSRPYVELGSVLALLMLSRLDSVFFVAIFGGVRLLIGLIRKERLVQLAFIPGIPILCLALYMGLNLVLFDTPMPVSGQAKSLGTEGLPNWSVFPTFFWQRPVRIFPFIHLDYGRWFLLLFVPTFVLCAFREWRHWTSPEAAPADGFRWLERFFACLLLTNAVQLGYYAFSSSWHLWPHYYYYATLALFLAPPILVHALAERAWPRVERPVAVVLSLLLAVIVVNAVRNRAAREIEPPFADYKRASVEVAAYLNTETEPGAVFAMGDRAGSLGFQLDRPLVHTEGLVNSKAYLGALEEGRVHAFLREERVDYVIYSGGPESGGDPVPVDTPGRDHCARFVEPKFGSGPKVSFVVCDEDRIFGEKLSTGSRYDVWRYRPELNRDP